MNYVDPTGHEREEAAEGDFCYNNYDRCYTRPKATAGETVKIVGSFYGVVAVGATATLGIDALFSLGSGGAAAGTEAGASAAGAETAGVSAAGAEAATATFAEGALFEQTLTVGGRQVGVLAETSIQGGRLILKDISIYQVGAEAANTIGQSAFRQALRALMETARSQGFTELQVLGQRVAGSTSANPGHVIDLLFKLTE